MYASEQEKIDSLPFFYIIGRPRSGTTMLQLFFDAHPNVQIPSECMNIWQLHTKYKSITCWDNKNIELYINDLKNTVYFTPTKFDIRNIENDLNSLSEKLNYSIVCKIVAKHYYSTFNKKEIQLLGDKNPIYSQNFKDIFPLINNSKFVHLIRDPRDSYISVYNARFSAPSITFNTLYWKYSLLTINKFKKKYPEKFYTIKYEDLVEDPEKYVKQICEFLGISYYPEMLNYRNNIDDKFIKAVFKGQYIYNKYFTSVAEPVSKSKVDLWKGKLSDKAIKKSEYIAGNLLNQYGYERRFQKVDMFTKLATLPGWLFYVYIELTNKYIKFRLPKLQKLKTTVVVLLSYFILWVLFVKKGKKL